MRLTPTQEVRQANPAPTAGSPGICGKFCQLQSAEEGPSSDPHATDYRAQADSRQLIKQLSATPTIPAQSAAGEPQNVPEAQAALRANKEVFFFRLVWIGDHDV